VFTSAKGFFVAKTSAKFPTTATRVQQFCTYIGHKVGTQTSVNSLSDTVSIENFLSLQIATASNT
jgi:hypothetical protein